jgi:antitoxin (DNA-binding transcriptional repressor) of toxin-antitoxin stability system
MQTATLSIRELKANPSWAIAQAQAGVSVLITSYRKVVAQLSPPPEAASRAAASELQARMDAMTAKGFLIQPSQPRRLHVPAYELPRIPGQPYQTMSDQIIEDRAKGW